MSLTFKSLFPILALLTFLCGCDSLQPFPNQKYQRELDLCLPYYESTLVNIRGLDIDSEQVSNKYMDPELLCALQKVNELLAQPQSLSPELQKILSSASLNKITLASAARTPWHQASLSTTYKAKAFSSMHSIGCAADLVMKGQPFDVARRGNEAEVQACYHALGEVLKSCGLIFSEPQAVDANHVELMRYSRKSTAFDEAAWRQKNLAWWLGLQSFLQAQDETRASRISSQQARTYQRLLADIELEIRLLEN